MTEMSDLCHLRKPRLFSKDQNHYVIKERASDAMDKCFVLFVQKCVL